MPSRLCYSSHLTPFFSELKKRPAVCFCCMSFFYVGKSTLLVLIFKKKKKEIHQEIFMGNFKYRVKGMHNSLSIIILLYEHSKSVFSVSQRPHPWACFANESTAMSCRDYRFQGHDDATYDFSSREGSQKGWKHTLEQHITWSRGCGGRGIAFWPSWGCIVYYDLAFDWKIKRKEKARSSRNK